jgi:hypothetical protein
MAQDITPELEAILLQELQVGDDKPRAELEIDYVDPATPAATLSSWRYLEGATGHSAGFEAPAFVDSGWSLGDQAFGLNDLTYDGPIVTPWPGHNDDLCLRAHLDVPADVTAVQLRVRIDVSGEVWVNGASIGTVLFSDNPYKVFDLVSWNVGDNVIAVRAHADDNQNRFTLEVVTEPSYVATEVIQVASIDLDRSRKMAAAQLDALLDNELNDRGWYTQPSIVFAPNNPVRAFAWYGDPANRVRVFTGLFDRIAEHRNPKRISVKARSRMKWMLGQGFVATAPQGADEEGAVRTEDNGVYLGKSPEYIFGDICDRAGWPSADRSVGTSGFTLAEYDLTDKGSWADQIAGADRLTTATGWDLWEDELGVIHFEPSPLIATLEPTPAWDFAAGVNVLALDHQVDDEARATRVEVGGPMTSAVPIWEQTWSTSVLDYPAGAWYDPADPDNIRVIDRRTKYIYTIRQSDRAIVAKRYLGGYPFGLSGDPLDPSHYYVLNAPFWNTGSQTGNSVKEYRKSDNALLATHALPDGKWSSLKTDGVNLWLANYGDHKIYKRSMTAVAVSSATISYGGAVQERPTGIWINGTTMGVFFSAYKRFLLVTTAAPTVVTGVQSTEGTRIAGGEADTDTDTDLYVVSGKGSWGLTSGMVAKFALAELVTTDVTALAIDYDLEDELGRQSGIADRDHGDCPNDGTTHPFEARPATYSMKVVQSLAQAQDVADAQLALLSRLRRVLDLGTIGHPGIQINDPISYVDAIAGIDSTWIIDSYRIKVAQTYIQTMSLLPWEAPA